MRRLVHSLRSQSIGIVALFIALGGTGYAALSIPAGSVGARQIKNHSIPAIKLDGRSIAGYVAFWARIDKQGGVLASSAPVRTMFWASGQGQMYFRARLSHDCFALTSSADVFVPGGVATVRGTPNRGLQQHLLVSMVAPTAVFTPLAVDVAEICP